MRGKERYTPYLFILPSVLVILMVIIYPLLYVVYMAFSKYKIVSGRLQFSFVGLRNFVDILNTPSFLPTMINTGIFVFCSVFGAFVLSMVLALSLNRITRFKSLFRTVMLLPWIVPLTVAGFMWKWVLNEVYGILNHTLHQMSVIHGMINWLGSTPLSMISLISVDIWANSPLMILVLLTGIEQIPEEILESAQIDGANLLQRLRYIIIPFIRMHIITVVTIRTIFALRAFDLAYVLTGGGPGYSTNIAGLEIYMQGVRFLNLNYSSAFSMIILSITIIISVLIVGWARKAA